MFDKKCLTIYFACAIIIFVFRGVAQLVAHTSGGRGAAGSSPVTPTISSVLVGFKLFYKDTHFLCLKIMNI